MINQQLLDYISQQLKQGTTKEKIKSALQAGGWMLPDIEEAFNSLSTIKITEPIKISEPLKVAKEIDSTNKEAARTSSPFTKVTSSSKDKSDLKDKIEKKNSPLKIKKILIIAGSIMGGILLLGGSTLAYFKYFASPEKIIQKMMTKLETVETFEYSSEIKVIARLNTSSLNPFADKEEINIETKEEKRFTLNFSGTNDLKNKNQLQSQSTLKLTTNAFSEVGKNLAIGLEARSLAKIFYLKFTDLSILDALGGLIDTSKILNKWIKYDIEALSKQYGLEDLMAQFEASKNQASSSPSVLIEKKIKTAFQEGNIFTITKQLASEEIAGQKTHHFAFIPNEVGLKNLLQDISKDFPDNIDIEDINEFEKEYNDSARKNNIPQGEIWIGKKDFLPYKITFNINGDTATSSLKSIQITINLKNYNQAIKVEEPSDAVPAETFINELMMEASDYFPERESMELMASGTDWSNEDGFFEDTTDPLASTSLEISTNTEELKNNNNDSLRDLANKRDSDDDGLSDLTELQIGINPYNPDTDGDGFKDGDEVKGGYNPNGPGKLIE